MDIEVPKSVEQAGISIGFLLSYFLFTTILFVLFILLKKHSFAYPKVMLITGSIAILGLIIKKMLK